jgi:hypothetical protein
MPPLGLAPNRGRVALRDQPEVDRVLRRRVRELDSVQEERLARARRTLGRGCEFLQPCREERCRPRRPLVWGHPHAVRYVRIDSSMAR